MELSRLPSKAELKRWSAILSAGLALGGLGCASVFATGAKASAEKLSAASFPNDPQLQEQNTRTGYSIEKYPEFYARHIQVPDSDKVECWDVADTGFNTTKDVQTIDGHNNDGSSDITDTTGHGTGVIHVWAGEANNGFGDAGPASDLCNMHVIKDYPITNGNEYANHIAADITYAADHGAEVILIESQAPRDMTIDSMQPIYKATTYAKSKGALPIIPVGNSSNGDDLDQHPEVNRLPEAPYSLVVGGVNTDMTTNQYSMRGAKTVDANAMMCLASVGKDGNMVLYPDGRMAALCGTSIAGPQAAAAATISWACRKLNGQTNIDPINDVKHDVVSAELENKTISFDGTATAAGCPEAPPPPTTSTNTTTTTPEKKYTLIAKVTAGANLGRLTINGNKMTSPIYQTTVKGQVETIRPLKKTPKAYVKNVTGCENKELKKTVSPLLQCFVKLDGVHAGKPVGVENVRYAFASH